jgi:hypothetical protein
MKFEKINGKYWLKNREGEEVGFNFPVDAREALNILGEDGKPIYRRLEDEIEKSEKKQKEPQKNVEPVVEVKSEDSPKLGNKFKAKRLTSVEEVKDEVAEEQPEE